MEQNVQDEANDYVSNFAELGERLRSLRIERGWTLEQLAGQARLSIGYLSRLENGDRRSPSLAALLQVARALEVSLAALLAAPSDMSALTPQPERTPRSACNVVRAADARPREGNGLFYTPLSPAERVSHLQPVRLVVPARREQRGPLYRHDGEEWLYVLRGTLRLTLGSTDNGEGTTEVYELGVGDSAHFDAHMPHRLAALKGEDAEVILVACVAPLPLLGSYQSDGDTQG